MSITQDQLRMLQNMNYEGYGPLVCNAVYFRKEPDVSKEHVTSIFRVQ
jgi:hypothetical protein